MNSDPAMADTEGVIKYQLEFTRSLPITADVQELNTWRSILHGLELIGQNPSRYLGYGFGNISCRAPQNAGQFIISASQTGAIAHLTSQHYSLVEYCDIDNNRVCASGSLPPSSEALTHAMVYQTLPSTQCVMHVHDPRLWRFGLDQGLPQTGADTEYGTLQMAREVRDLFSNSKLPELGVLFMAGHEDGLLSFGDSIEQAGARMVQLWIDAQPD